MLSIVIPIHNEAAGLRELLSRLAASCAELAEPVEFIAVNDGSTDGSLDELKRLRAADSRLQIISLTRNFGQQVAFSAGLRHAGGEAVVLMDGDLQDPPEVIPEMVAAWRQGSDVVYAVRRHRQEPLLKRQAYWLFYRLLARMAEPAMPVDAGDFSLLSRRAVTVLNSLPERNRFLRGLRSWTGLKQTAVAYDRPARQEGRSSYTLWKLIRLALDGMVGFSHAPLRLASLAGFLSAGLAVLGILVFAYFRIFTTTFIPGYTSMIIAILFIGGIQLFAIGILGEYVARIYDEVKQRPLYVIDELIGFPDPPPAR